MRNYMIRRAGHSAFIVIGLMALLFFATNVLGDPVELMVSDDASEQAIASLRAKYGLDRPMYVRFTEFVGNVFILDFDTSFRYNIPAKSLVFQRLPNTAVLAFVAWGIGMVGIPIGMLAARRPRGLVDRFVNVLSFAIISIPDFWLALLLILFISVQLDILPTSGFVGLQPSGWHFIILPAVALCWAATLKSPGLR